jgi:hypothetical protein
MMRYAEYRNATLARLLAAGATAMLSLAFAAARLPAVDTPEFAKLKPAFEDPAQGWQSLYQGQGLDQWSPLKHAASPPKPNDWLAPASVSLDTAAQPGLARSEYSLSKVSLSGSSPGGAFAPAFVNNREGRSDNLITKQSYRDVELYVESMVAPGSNSGVCLMGIYEIQIRDSYGRTKLKYGDNGGIYARVVKEQRVGGEPPRVNASRRPGQWQSFHIWFQAPLFDTDGKKLRNARFLRIEHNGVQIHGDYELPGSTRGRSPWEEKPAAPLLLQGDHGPVAFRNIYIRPLRVRDIP